ncbi:hypothetical protein PLICRDRAFT_100435 [Plicaturopsis crispa FD-325 SS-3]|nr:hypothetical protein PLICRDRAFT_100435 [Plicaturopsis crispa FD-325 SS-3]
MSTKPIDNIVAGDGRVVLRAHGPTAAFTELSYTYPLKLLSPRSVQDRIAVLYALTYGGGLVGGDRVNLSINVGADTVLVSLTQQGSTKVFKKRPGGRRAAARSKLPSAQQDITAQTMDVTLAAQSALFLLPDPVTCFRAASYTQKQVFRLSSGASIVLLDWITSGRKSLGEDWVFSRYYSLNEVWLDGKRIARDVLLLEEPDAGGVPPLPPRTLADTLAPYACYATVILHGPLVQDVIRSLAASYERISVFRQGGPPDLVWSLSPLAGDVGHVVRVAATETEYVKNWLASALRGLEKVVGVDVYRTAFS